MGVQGESRHLPMAVVQDAEVLAVPPSPRLRRTGGCKGRGSPLPCPPQPIRRRRGDGSRESRNLHGRPAYLPGRNPGGSAGDGQSPRKVRAVVPAHTLYSFLSLYL